MKRICLSLLFLLSLLLSACGGEVSPPPADGEVYFSFTDALGRQVTLSRQPQRVAALLGSFADVWTLAGGELCACAEDAWEDFALTPENAVNIGGAHSPNAELLLSSAPELVLASAATASHVELLETLEAAGISVAYFRVEDFYSYLHMLDICTGITGRRDLYRQNGLQLQQEIEAVKALYAQAEIPAGQRSVLLLRASSSSVKAKGSQGTILGEMLADMGCRNIADQDSSLLENLSMEAILRQQPHHIFVVTMGSNTDAALDSLQQLIRENPAWSSLEAVRQGRLHVMDKTLFNLKPNARWAQAYQTLYETLT